MGKFLFVLFVLVAAGVIAGVSGGANATRLTGVSSGIFMESTNTLYPMTCDEQQIVNANQRKETFHCTFDAAIPPTGVYDTSNDAFWFSDFDGADAVSTHWTISRKGGLEGWALY